MLRRSELNEMSPVRARARARAREARKTCEKQYLSCPFHFFSETINPTGLGFGMDLCHVKAQRTKRDEVSARTRARERAPRAKRLYRSPVTLQYIATTGNVSLSIL